MIQYLLPDHWIRYDRLGIADVLTEAKAAVLSLQTVPYQKRWVDALQKLELKREVAGTSRIEGAEFTDRELDRVMKEETPDELFTRSQRQAAAALKAYEWIKTLPVNRPADEEIILEIHRLMVIGADDDHCAPGKLRSDGVNVTFGTPKHRGAEGGATCETAFARFVAALQTEFRGHDPLVQAIAAHYHIAAMHPFEDGNGRTARALEALMLRRASMRDTTFIAMSNYYYEEKANYLNTLAAVRAANNDLTPFLRFALRGVELQAKRLLADIQREIKRELFRTLMRDFYERLRAPRKRVVVKRQVQLVEILLAADSMPIDDFVAKAWPIYEKLKSPNKALGRDASGLINLNAIEVDTTKKTVWANLDWPTEITATQFYEAVKKMPTASTSWLTK